MQKSLNWRFILHESIPVGPLHDYFISYEMNELGIVRRAYAARDYGTSEDLKAKALAPLESSFHTSIYENEYSLVFNSYEASFLLKVKPTDLLERTFWRELAEVGSYQPYKAKFFSRPTDTDDPDFQYWQRVTAKEDSPCNMEALKATMEGQRFEWIMDNRSVVTSSLGFSREIELIRLLGN